MPNEKAGWRPAADQAALRARAILLERIRLFFSQRKVMEVETPLLSAAGNSDPGISQFSLQEQACWLRSSPEYPMKRLIAAGSGDIYELGRVFRAGESGRHHNPEFTMLEWYRCGWTYHQLMDEVSDLVRHCIPDIQFTETRVSYRDLLLGYTGIDPVKSGDEELGRFIRRKGIDLEGLNRGQMLDLLISHFVQPELPEQAITFVYDYPPEQAALARIRQDDPPVAERFELLLGKVELANGYQELTDADEQKLRFEQENDARKAAGEVLVNLDRHLIEALHAGLPECAGVALGVDRLLMGILGTDSLETVLPFPSDRA